MAPVQKWALITGCGKGGIGEALCIEYKRQGVTPIATVLPNEPSDHLRDADIPFFILDVTSEESIIALKSSIVELTNGRLDILVNCAGIAYTMPATDADVKMVKKMFDVNLFGPMVMVNQFHDLLIKYKGTIVNISSIAGVIPYLWGSGYNASKAALYSWGNTLRVELQPFDVNVITIISGEVGTNILKGDTHRRLPEGSFYSPLADFYKNHVTRKPSGATDRFEWASKVVGHTTQPKANPWFWYGNFTGWTRLYEAIYPRTAWDSTLWKWFNLKELQAAHKARLGKA